MSVITNAEGVSNWRAAYNSIQSGTDEILNIVCLGDSVVDGYYSTVGASTYSPLRATLGWVGKLRTIYASIFDDVGIGINPCWWHTRTESSNYPFAELITFAGTWSYLDGIGFGPRIAFTVTPGATATLPFTGVGATFIYVIGPDIGTFTWAVDGGSTTQIDAYSLSIDYASLDIDGLEDGSHTLVLTKDDTNTNHYFYPAGVVEHKGTRGVRCHMSGLASTIAGSLFIGFTTALNGPLVQLEPDLLIIAYGTNEYNAGISPSTFGTYVGQILAERAPTTDALLVSYELGDWPEGSVKPYAMKEYTDICDGLAFEYNCAHLNICKKYDYDYQQWYAGGYTDTLGYVHPSIAGHALIANEVSNALLPQPGTVDEIVAVCEDNQTINISVGWNT